MKTQLRFVIVLMVILLSACKNQSTKITTQSSTTPLGLPPTWTPDTKTFTPSPTSIIVYSRTPTSTSRPTPTITKTLRPSETPYYLKADFPKACQEQYGGHSTLISPDRNWLAEDCYSFGGLQVSNKAREAKFLIPFKKFYNSPLYPNLSGSMRPVHWANDSQYIYFTVTPEGWMDGGNISISELAPSLYRMNISDGETSKILSGLFYHSFSPTDRRLIEVQEYKHPVKIIIHDITSGSNESLIPNGDSRYSQAGRAIWSPDGLKFIFVAGFGLEYGDEVSEPMAHSLIIVDLTNLVQQIVISEIPDEIEPVNWDANDVITYDIIKYANGHETRLVHKYDYKSKTAINQSTPTP